MDLHISAEEFRRLYAGSASAVRAVAVDGRSVRFPARILVPFVGRDGIRGRFQLIYGDDNRLQSIRRITI